MRDCGDTGQKARERKEAPPPGVDSRGITRVLLVHSFLSFQPDLSHTRVSEHSQMNKAWRTMPWRTVKETQEKKGEGLSPQVCFVSWIILGCDPMPPVINIYSQCKRHVYSCL